MVDAYMSRAAYKKLEAQIEELIKEKARVAQDVEEARQQGDLRENAGYHAAKERLSEILRLIHEGKEKLQSAKFTDELDVDKSEVHIGATVTVEMGGEEFTYQLVGDDEADPLEDKISVNSPIAQGLMDHKQGAVVEIDLPAGKSTFKITKIAY